MKVLTSSGPVHRLFVVGLICSQVMSSKPSDQEKPAEVPTQTKVAMRGVVSYFFKELPQNLGKNLLELGGFGDFRFFEHLAVSNPDQSVFRMFQFTQERRIPADAWSLSFTNHRPNFSEKLKVEYGLCAGVTYLTRRMNLLAIYDVENTAKQVVPDRIQNYSEWLMFMKGKIDEIMDLKMTVIPGFKNLDEFSTEPGIKSYLMDKAIELWRKVDVNFLQGYVQGLLESRTAQLSPSERINLHKKLTERLALGYNPVVYLVQQNKKHLFKDAWIHTLQVTDIKPMAADGSFEFSVWDVNLEDKSQLQVLKVGADGVSHYNGRDLASVVLLRWDDLEIATIIKNNLAFCATHPQYCLKQ